MKEAAEYKIKAPVTDSTKLSEKQKKRENDLQQKQQRRKTAPEYLA